MSFAQWLARAVLLPIAALAAFGRWRARRRYRRKRVG